MQYPVFLKDRSLPKIVVNSAGKIFSVNPAFEVFSGYTKQELEGKRSWRDFFPVEDMRKIEEQLDLSSESPTDHECNFIDKSGNLKRIILTIVPLSDQTKLLLFVDVDPIEDIFQKHFLLETAFSYLEEAVFITNASWHIKYANFALERLLGYSQKEILGQDARLVIKDEAIYTRIKTSLSERKKWKGRLSLKDREGNVHEVAITVFPVEERGNVHYIATLHDITKELKLDRRIYQAEKMETIGTLTGGIVHDFNNLLTPILAYSEMLLNEISPQIPVHQKVKKIAECAYQAKELIRQILSFSRHTEPAKIPIQVGLVSQKVFKLLRILISKQIEMQINLESKGFVLADPIHRSTRSW